MKIIHTINSVRSEDGGPSYSVPALCRALLQEGVDVELWTQDKSVAAESELLIRQVLPQELQHELQKVVNSNPAMIVHDHGIWLPWNHKVATAARRLDLPRMVSPRGMLDPWALNYGAWKKKIAWWLYQKNDLRKARMIHATSDQEAGHIANLGIRTAVTVCPNGVDVPPGDLRNEKPSGARRTMLFLSRIHPKKGLLDLVEAWKRIDDPNWQIKIVGPDENGHRAEVEAAIKLAGLKSIAVESAVSGREKWQTYADADLFVLPSYSENFGLVIAEALAAGVPVITTHATPWEELKTLDCGWWIPTGPESLEAALRDATSRSGSELEMMGERGKNLIRSQYSWSAVGATMMRSYASLLHKT